MFLTMKVLRSMEVTDPFTGFTTDVKFDENSEQGIIGFIPVFKDKKSAEKWVGDDPIDIVEVKSKEK